MVVRLDKTLDFAELRGQLTAKRAMEIAAAGGHHIALIGPSGCGKSSLASAFAGIIPALTADQQAEISAFLREAGRSWPNGSIPKRPTVTPSAVSTPLSLIGGRSPRHIGELAYADHGLVIVDDADRFKSRSLGVLREALDRGEVRPSGGPSRPTRFQLLVTARTSPCSHPCALSLPCDGPVGRELQRLRPSLGWFIDIVDMQIMLQQPTPSDWASKGGEEPSFRVFRRVAGAWLCQTRRGKLNRELNGRALNDACPMEHAAEVLLDRAVIAQEMSGRDAAATIRIARTLADLEGLEILRRVHIAEALIYRFLPARLYASSDERQPLSR